MIAPSVDVNRTVKARPVSGAAFCDDNAQPGDITTFEPDGAVEELAIACPGCGRRSLLPLVKGQHCRWTVTAGDVRNLASLTLSPSIFHRVEDGGCGWHGYLRSGVFEPC